MTAHRLDVEALQVETFPLGTFARWGKCTNPACTVYDLLDEDGACHDCYLLPPDTAGCDDEPEAEAAAE